MASMFERASQFFAHLQDQICDALARLDGRPFAKIPGPMLIRGGKNSDLV